MCILLYRTIFCDHILMNCPKLIWYSKSSQLKARSVSDFELLIMYLKSCCFTVKLVKSFLIEGQKSKKKRCIIGAYWFGMFLFVCVIYLFFFFFCVTRKWQLLPEVIRSEQHKIQRRFVETFLFFSFLFCICLFSFVLRDGLLPLLAF